MRTRQRCSWLFGPFLLLACTQPAPDISEDIETYANLVSDANTLTCDCPPLLGLPDTLQCNDTLAPVGTDERQCLATVVDGHEEAAREYLTCANAAYQSYVDCLETNVNCEQSIYDDCTADHENAMDSCPQMPSDVQSGFEACAD